MDRMNLGCGPDIKEGWVNVDSVYRPGIEVWSAQGQPLPQYIEQFDFVLVNHVLCTMKPSGALEVLKHARMCLKEGGKVQVIDMDLLKVFESYQDGRADDIPIEEGDIDDRLCLAISGYGTRLSLYTTNRLENLLYEAGYRLIHQIDESPYDTRPKESLVFEATK